ncbi:hypothetical protein DFH06DRAFT_1246868 [Mycena polygramma]|nr:hypothetical protein DFH06DRAFT_1246868 [Mycena polygramma]
MHRCLNVLEIVEAICEYLADPDLTGPARWHNVARSTALTALARTSRTMSAPALDVLWRSQNQIEPFLRLLPSGLFAPLVEGVWRVVRPIMVSDWERPLVYAPRVRFFSMAFYSRHHLSDIMHALSACCPGGILFPNLRGFRWYQRIPDFPWRIFCPSTLKRILLTLDGSNAAISLLSTLALSCPGLSDVSIDFRPASGHVDSATSMFICGLRGIETLPLRHITRLLGLSTLEITGTPTPLPPWDPLSPPSFAHLRHITLGPLEIARAIEFFGSFVDSPIVSIQVTLAAFVTVAETDSLFGKIQAACSQTHLRSFVLRNRGWHWPTHGLENYTINGHSLDILSCFSGITTLLLESPIRCDADDAAIERLAVALPRLENLTLPGMTSTPTRLTLNSVHSLAKHCPQLNSLEMEFTPTSIPENTGPNRVVQKCLYTLMVCCSPIVHPAPVARYLSSVFPNLGSIPTAREGEDNDDPEEIELNGEAISWYRLWKQVEEYVPEFVAARKEEHADAPS